MTTTLSPYELDNIWDGFIEAIDFTESDRDDQEEEGYIEPTGEVEYGDMRRYVDNFAQANAQDCALVANISPWGWHSVGHDLWMTAQGHGCGFWDRGYGALGDRLTTAAKEAGLGCDSYIGEGGTMYFCGFEPIRCQV